MLPFQKIPKHKHFRSPPEHFAIGYVHNDNLPLGKLALQYVIQNNCRKVWLCFLMIFYISEDQEKICRIHQNYLVALTQVFVADAGGNPVVLPLVRF